MLHYRAHGEGGRAEGEGGRAGGASWQLRRRGGGERCLCLGYHLSACTVGEGGCVLQRIHRNGWCTAGKDHVKLIK